MKAITLQQQQDIDNAKELLKSYGYYTENLWHIRDVTTMHECSDDDAYMILSKSMKNDVVCETIFGCISDVIIDTKVN